MHTVYVPQGKHKLGSRSAVPCDLWPTLGENFNTWKLRKPIRKPKEQASGDGS